MAAVHFTTVPRNLTQPIRHKESQILCSTSLCTMNIEKSSFEDFITFLYIIMDVV